MTLAALGLLFFVMLPQLIVLFFPLILLMLAVRYFSRGLIRPGFGVGRTFSFLGGMLLGRSSSPTHGATAFRVTTTDGTTIECLLPGELVGGSIRHGDRVEVRGRMKPFSRTLQANRIRNLDTGAVTTGRVPLTARVAPIIALGVVVLITIELVSR